MDRKNLFPRMTRQELMLLQCSQRGIRQVRESFIDIKKYLEPSNPKSDRRRRYKRKRKYFEMRGIKNYEKL